MADSKTCFKCNATKPVNDFYRHHAMSDGRLGKCKECTKADVRENRLLNIDHYRAFDRSRSNLPHRVNAREEYARTDAGKSMIAKAQSAWFARNKDKRAAHYAVSNAIRDGRLHPLPCFICGEKAGAHHPDYSARLDVVWLCNTHHKQVHKEHREMLRQQSRLSMAQAGSAPTPAV